MKAWLLVLVFVLLALITVEALPDCQALVDRGSGNKRERKFAYVHARNQCEPFFYKGSGGNSNRFNSFNACTTACKVPISAPTPTSPKVIIRVLSNPIPLCDSDKCKK